MTNLDLNFVRQHFPAFAHKDLSQQIHCENAGGSYPVQHTIDRLFDFYHNNKIQPYHPNYAGMRAGNAMDEAYSMWAEALGVDIDDINFGPSTSQNTYVLSQAFEQSLQDGDEVIVTNADHEANSGAMRKMAARRGLMLREWCVNPETGQLQAEDLQYLLNNKTALVCMPHCSNVIGQANPVADWTKMVKSFSQNPWVVVDGVSHAPHQLPDVGVIGCDVYLFSLYKVYSVHQGMMIIRNLANKTLPNQGHFFNDGNIHSRLTPAGPDHAQVAASRGVLEYIQDCDRHHGGDGSLRNAVLRVNKLWLNHEQDILQPLLGYLKDNPKTRLLGADTNQNRNPTVSVVVDNPKDICTALGQHNIMAGCGHFYAMRLVKALGIDPDTGVLRISLVHYNSHKDVENICRALDQIL